jgi:hypothetical protein
VSKNNALDLLSHRLMETFSISPEIQNKSWTLKSILGTDYTDSTDFENRDRVLVAALTLSLPPAKQIS